MVRFGRGFMSAPWWRAQPFARLITDPLPTGWDVWIDGHSIKDKIQQRNAITIKFESAELSEMTFRTLWSENYVPAQFLDAYAFDDDGSKLFGGLVRFRDVTTVGTTSRYADVTCLSWWFYFTVTFVTVQSDDPITLKEIIVAALAQVPLEYGLTLDPAQPDGPTLDSFDSGEDVAASELFRRLQADTADLGAYAPGLTPLKVFSMYPAGTVPAPLSLTDASPNCTQAKWKDPNDVPANHIKLVCGVAGEGGILEQSWVATGSIFTFSLLGLNIPASPDIMNLTNVDGTDYPTWQAGQAPGGEGIEFDPATDDGTLSFIGATAQALIPFGAVVTINYQPQMPFTVEDGTGATPRISAKRTRPDIHTYADALVAVAGLVAQLGQSLKELEVVSLQNVWRPSQALVVALTQLDLDATFTIDQVTIVKKYDQWWESRFSAQDTTIPQPSRMERTRSLIAAMAGRS